MTTREFTNRWECCISFEEVDKVDTEFYFKLYLQHPCGKYVYSSAYKDNHFIELSIHVKSAEIFQIFWNFCVLWNYIMDATVESYCVWMGTDLNILKDVSFPMQGHGQPSISNVNVSLLV